MRLTPITCLPCSYMVLRVSIPVYGKTKKITVHQAAKIAADFSDIPLDALKSNSRKRAVCEVRFIVFSLMRKHTTLSLAAIGDYFNRDHATVLSGINQCDNLRSVDSKYRHLYRMINSAMAMDVMERVNKND